MIFTTMDGGGGLMVDRAIGIDEMRRVDGYWYLATPYSKFPGGLEAAFAAAADLAAKLIALQVPVYSPIAHTHPIALVGGLDPLDHSIWLPADRPLMAAAHGLLVAALPSWEESFGIAQEIADFQRRYRPIVRLDIEAEP